jgi:hypothetical protein
MKHSRQRSESKTTGLRLAVSPRGRKLRIPHFSSVRKRIAVMDDGPNAEVDVDAPSVLA